MDGSFSRVVSLAGGHVQELSSRLGFRSFVDQISSIFLLLLRRVREYTFIFEFRRICPSTCLLNHFSTRLCALSCSVSQEPPLPAEQGAQV